MVSCWGQPYLNKWWRNQICFCSNCRMTIPHSSVLRNLYSRLNCQCSILQKSSSAYRCSQTSMIGLCCWLMWKQSVPHRTLIVYYSFDSREDKTLLLLVFCSSPQTYDLISGPWLLTLTAHQACSINQENLTSFFFSKCFILVRLTVDPQ